MELGDGVDILRDTMTVALMIVSPILLAGLVIGLTVSIFQAVTQIQEQTLQFVPKIIGMGIAAIAIMPWISMRLFEFAKRMFEGSG